MDDFQDFAQWLFPDYDSSLIARNPNIPKKVYPLLKEVAECTNIELSWIERVAGLVIEGLAGLQCLWFLHGASGTITVSDAQIGQFGVPRGMGGIGMELHQLIRTHIAKTYERLLSRGRPVILDYGAQIEWDDGVLLERIRYAGPDEKKKPKETRKRLGKWLQKQGASTKLQKAFKTRDLSTWEWKISASPYDILTMSHDRPWTSCMRPGGEYQYGPLTDMAAGSAIIFFYRPGAKKPCGRRILRPNIYKLREEWQGGILDGGRLYGCGPNIEEIDIEKMIHRELPVARSPLCLEGRYGRALSRYIYSDVDHKECQQDDEEYEAAYQNLEQYDWPEPNLDFSRIRAVAESFKGLIEIDEIDEEEESFDVPDISSATHDHIIDTYESVGIFNALDDPAILADWISEYISDIQMWIIPDHIFDDVYESVRESLISYLIELVSNNKTMVFAVPPDLPSEEKHLLGKITSNMLSELTNPEFAWSTAVQELGLETEDMSDWYLDDELVGEVLMVPYIFHNEIPSMISSYWYYAEIDDYDWERAIYQKFGVR